MQPQYTQPGFSISANTLGSILQGIGRFFFSINFVNFLYVLLALFVIAMITLVLYLLVRLYEIRMEDKKKAAAVAMPSTLPSTSIPAGGADVTGAIVNETWKHIREKLLSNNDSDWKLGVIEADIYMDKVLDDKGFHGDTTGDKLKQVTADKLPSVSIAWEVHKVRNRIAHEGAAFVLTMPEARRMLTFYEMIYTDLGVI